MKILFIALLICVNAHAQSDKPNVDSLMAKNDSLYVHKAGIPPRVITIKDDMPVCAYIKYYKQYSLFWGLIKFKIRQR